MELNDKEIEALHVLGFTDEQIQSLCDKFKNNWR
jgi:Holliday junction resolvasome RuvABC DNA-binding subunit